MEAGAHVEGDYPVQFVAYGEAKDDPALHLSETTTLIGDNVRAGRILAAVSFLGPGNWTCWPPDGDSDRFELAQLYTEIPGEFWGIQMVCRVPGIPEILTLVRQDDCVSIPEGHHLNIAGPGARIGYLRMMAARREGEDRRMSSASATIAG